MEQEFLRIIESISKNYSPATIGAAAATIIITLKFVIPYVISAGEWKFSHQSQDSIGETLSRSMLEKQTKYPPVKYSPYINDCRLKT